MTACPSTTGEPCPQCGEADLRPHGNGSKWICPRCYFLLPCCEGGEQPSRAGYAPTPGTGRYAFTHVRP